MRWSICLTCTAVSSSCLALRVCSWPNGQTGLAPQAWHGAGLPCGSSEPDGLVLARSAHTSKNNWKKYMFELIDYKFTYHSRTCLHMNLTAAVSAARKWEREGGSTCAAFHPCLGMTIYGFSSERWTWTISICYDFCAVMRQIRAA